MSHLLIPGVVCIDEGKAINKLVVRVWLPVLSSSSTMTMGFGGEDVFPTKLNVLGFSVCHAL